jgi:hypothetical protein
MAISVLSRDRTCRPRRVAGGPTALFGILWRNGLGRNQFPESADETCSTRRPWKGMFAAP